MIPSACSLLSPLDFNRSTKRWVSKWLAWVGRVEEKWRDEGRGKGMVCRGAVVARAKESALPFRVTDYDSLPLDKRKPVRLVHGCDNVAKDIFDMLDILLTG